jgi:hypothetical protein
MLKVIGVVGCGFLLAILAIHAAAQRDLPEDCYKSQLSYVNCLKQHAPPPLELDAMMRPTDGDESSENSEIRFAAQRSKAKPATKAAPKVPPKPTKPTTKPTSVAQKPTFVPVNTNFPGRGGLKWAPSWGPQISQDQYKPLRTIIVVR